MQMGVMADEAEKVQPESVKRINGKRHVNYGTIH